MIQMVVRHVRPSTVRLLCILGIGAVLVLHPGIARASPAQRLHISFQPRSTVCTEAVAKGPNGVTSHPGDGVTPINLCLHVEDALTGDDLEGIPLEVRVTVGTVGVSGAFRYSGVLFSSAAGVAQISYRGDGTSFGGDTAVATSAGGHTAAIASIEVTPPAGRYATRIEVINPAERVIAASDTRPGSAYRSPTPGASVAVQVRDVQGRGVNGHVLLITSERARIAANPGFTLPLAAACAAATARSILVTTNATDVPAVGGQARPGTVNLVLCATDEEPPGEARIHAMSVTDPLLPARTLAIPRSTRPVSIETQVEAGALVARVEDATGAPVADGTPVRFAIAPSAGVVSADCVATRGGEARVTVGLDRAEAAVLVSAEYAATGAAATCTVTGNGRVQATAHVTASLLAAAPATTAAGG